MGLIIILGATKYARYCRGIFSCSLQLLILFVVKTRIKLTVYFVTGIKQVYLSLVVVAISMVETRNGSTHIVRNSIHWITSTNRLEVLLGVYFVSEHPTHIPKFLTFYRHKMPIMIKNKADFCSESNSNTFPSRTFIDNHYNHPSTPYFSHLVRTHNT